MRAQDTSKAKKTGLESSFWTRTRTIISTLWLLEFFYWSLSFACFAGIVGTLIAYDGLKLPDLAWGISLNTLVSLLASLATFSLMVPVTAGLGQLKWLWFGKARQVIDYERIESARNGPVGSLKLLLRGTGGWLACIGAFVTIGMIAYGPFVQQIISTPLREIPQDGAALPVAQQYYATEGIDPDELPLPMRSAIMAGMLSANASTRQWNIQPGCPTGNCTWPLYETLAVCSTCGDLTSNLTLSRKGNSTTWRLPNGLTQRKTSNLGTMMTVSNTAEWMPGDDAEYYDSVIFKGGGTSLVDMFVILQNESYLSSTQNRVTARAAECKLNFCAQRFNASAVNGVFTETIASDAKPFTFNVSDYILYQPYSFNTSSASYLLGHDAIVTLQYYLQSLFDLTSEAGETATDVMKSIEQGLGTPPYTLDAIFRNIAESMTLAMRTRTGPNTLIQGQYFLHETFIRVNWPWVIFPAVVELVVLFFLVGVVVATKRARLNPWKQNSLASLFHGIRCADGEAFQHLLSEDQMERAGRDTTAVLVMERQGTFLELDRRATDYVPLQVLTKSNASLSHSD